MSLPKETYDVYFLQAEWLKNRADIELFNTDTFSKAFRRNTLTTAFLYDEKTDKKIGEYTSSLSQVSSLISPFVNTLSNDAVNIFDKLILPNVSSGFIYKDGDSFDKIHAFYPPRVISQDIFGRKVVVLINTLEERDVVGKIKFRFEVYEEDF